MANTITVAAETLEQKIARLEAENAQLKAVQTRTLGCKISDKGGVVVYGLGKFPTTLYQEQWEKLLDFGPQIRKFIAENRDKLSTKPRAVAA